MLNPESSWWIVEPKCVLKNLWHNRSREAQWTVPVIASSTPILLSLFAQQILFTDAWMSNACPFLRVPSFIAHSQNIFKMSRGTQKLFPKEQETALTWFKFFSKLSEYLSGLPWTWRPKNKWQWSSLYNATCQSPLRMCKYHCRRECINTAYA